LGVINYMKQIAIIFLLLTYLLPSIGITISKHYCGGELSSTQFLCFAQHECGCGEKEMKADCCRDESTTIKIDDEQNTSHTALVNTTTLTQSPIYLGINHLKSYSITDNEPIHIWKWHPPDKHNQGLYLKFGVLII
jgi:hypothetical protein